MSLIQDLGAFHTKCILCLQKWFMVFLRVSVNLKVSVTPI